MTGNAYIAGVGMVPFGNHLDTALSRRGIGATSYRFTPEPDRNNIALAALIQGFQNRLADAPKGIQIACIILLLLVARGPVARAEGASSDESTPASSSATGAPADISDAKQSAAGTSPVELTEVVVTARRKNESLLDSPAAVSVFTADQVEKAGIRRPEDIVATIPNMTIGGGTRAGENFVTIRGIAQARAADSVVAVIVDGVEEGTPAEFNQELYDIRQIEVLKGPQGALYGRNAIGGAIVITTAPPTDSLQANATVGYGNASSVNALGMLNVPIVPGRAYLRANAYHRQNDGFFENVYTGRNVDPSREEGAKVRLLVLPTDDLKIDLRGDFSDFSGGTLSNDLPQLGTINANDTSRGFQQNVVPRDVYHRYGASALISYIAPAGTLTLTPAYSYTNETLSAETFPFLQTGTNTQEGILYTSTKSAELKFSSAPEQRVTYIVGGYYAHVNRRDATQLGLNTGQGIVLTGYGPHGPDTLNPTLALTDDEYRYNVWALFGQFDVKILDNLDLSGAYRYDHETRWTENVVPPQFANGYGGVVRSRTFTGSEPKVTLSYKPIPSLNLYADYSQGFVSGGFNPAQTQAILNETGPNPVTPNNYGEEISKAFEVGAKAEFFGQHLRANIDYFHTKVDNLQQFQFIPQANYQATVPIDGATINGGELELDVRPVTGLDLFANGGYTDAVVSNFRANQAYVGNRTPYVPEYTVNTGFQYSHAVAALEGTFRLEAQRIGPQWFNVSNTPGSRRDAVDLINVRTSIGDGRWLLSAYARNLLNKQYNTDMVVVTPTIAGVYPALPRTCGVELKLSIE